MRIRTSSAAWVSAAGLFGIAFAGGCSGAPSSRDDSAPAAPIAVSAPADAVQPTAVSHKDWGRLMEKVPTPKPGCFVATQPGTTWQEIPCSRQTHARPVLLPPKTLKRTSAPLEIGSGAGDGVANTTEVINLAEGSFPTVTGMTTEWGLAPPSSGLEVSGYSLQLNTNYGVNQAVCATGPNGAGCTEWAQFFYIPTAKTFGIQYWLINYSASTSTSPAQCPPGFASFDNAVSNGTQVGHQFDCFATDAISMSSTPVEPISDLSEIMLSGLAGNGGDVATLYLNGSIVAFEPSGSSLVDLYQWWSDAEFNVFGPGGGSAAVFNLGTTMGVQLVTESFSPSSVLPTCGTPSSFTGEINNLNLVPGSCCSLGSATPGIFFTQSNVAGVAALSCP